MQCGSEILNGNAYGPAYWTSEDVSPDRLIPGTGLQLSSVDHVHTCSDYIN